MIFLFFFEIIETIFQILFKSFNIQILIELAYLMKLA